MSLPLPPKPPLPTTPVKRYDDFTVAPVYKAVRLDLYGEIHMPGDRCVAMLTPDAAMELSRQLASAALKEGGR